MVESAKNHKAVIFSDARSVLDAVSSSSGKKYVNYLIPLIKLKYYLLSAAGFSIQLVWIPSHAGIAGNESADATAKRAARNGHKSKFKIPHTDLFFSIKQRMETQFCSLLKEAFREKGVHYFSHFFHLSPKPWFHKYKLDREQIVTINRIRSNHYNLNYSLYRKNIVVSPACPCGDSRQDINHVIFYCRLTRNKAKCLLSLLFRQNPTNFLNIFPYINSPSHKLCRLLLAFLRSVNLYVWMPLPNHLPHPVLAWKLEQTLRSMRCILCCNGLTPRISIYALGIFSLLCCRPGQFDSCNAEWSLVPYLEEEDDENGWMDSEKGTTPLLRRRRQVKAIAHKKT